MFAHTPVAGYDAKKSISPNFPISRNKFLFEYAVILVIISPVTTFVPFSKSSVLINICLTRISFNISVQTALAKFGAWQSASHIDERLGVWGVE